MSRQQSINAATGGHNVILRSLFPCWYLGDLQSFVVQALMGCWIIRLPQQLLLFSSFIKGDRMQASSNVATRISALVAVLCFGLAPSTGWAQTKPPAPDVSNPFVLPT